MLRSDVQIISVDDHVIETPNVWQDRVAAKYKDAAPKMHTDDQGRDYWVFESRPYFNIGLNAVVGKPREKWGLDPTALSDMRPGCYDIKERLRDMDEDGIWAGLNFPSFPGFAGSTFFNATDKELSLVCIQAWNDWHLEEWCGAAPERQIPMAIVPYWDIAASAAEVRRVAANGSRTISFCEAPHAVGMPSIHDAAWDPFWAAINETGLPVSMHFGSGGAPNVAPGGPFTATIAQYGLNSLQCCIELVNSRIFEKFPNVKFALSEGGIGWMPWMLERCDYPWERHKIYTGMADAKKPSEIFREHIYGCFIADDAGIRNIDLIGEDNVMFESDYPHSDSNWPNARKMLEESLANTPDHIARKIAEDNARRLFNFPRK
jgi:predicted TIM-barrel fold metal-dependent hydrolase